MGNLNILNDMNRLLFLIFPFILINSCSSTKTETLDPEHTLWYDSPATAWEESLPLGNGRLGMMPDGGIIQERIILNEISLWSGSEADYANPDAAESLPVIRELLLEGKNAEAQDVMYERFIPHKPTNGGTYGTYQVLGGLFIDYHHGKNSFNDEENDIESNLNDTGNDHVEGYRRWLDLNTATAFTSYTIDRIGYERKYHVNREADVMTIELTADQKESVCFDMRLIRHYDVSFEVTDNGFIKMSGELDSGAEGVPGMKYAAYAAVSSRFLTP